MVHESKQVIKKLGVDFDKNEMVKMFEEVIETSHKNGLSALRAKLDAYEARFSLTPEMFVLKANLEAGVITDLTAKWHTNSKLICS